MSPLISKKHAIFQIVVFVIAWVIPAALVGPSEANRALRNKKPVIVIDPGHGGYDYGAQGSDKVLEKSVTLSLARMIAKCLENDYTSILTRTGDYWLDDMNRTAIANHHKAVLLLSIHASGSYRHGTDGVTVFFYKDLAGSDPASKPVTTLSLSESISGSNGPIVWDNIQRTHLPASKLMAETIRSRLMDQKDFSKTKLKGAPLTVLAGANMPAILLEIGYLTNPAKKKNLTDDDYLSDLAKAICIGIDDFF